VINNFAAICAVDPPHIRDHTQPPATTAIMDTKEMREVMKEAGYDVGAQGRLPVAVTAKIDELSAKKFSREEIVKQLRVCLASCDCTSSTAPD
jgi:hypothetical protein